MSKWMTTLLGATLSLSVMAQQDELQALPGYVEFGELSSVYGEPKVMINIGGSLLNFMSAATKDDPEASKVLQGLKGVRINVYSTEGQTGPALEQLTKVKAMLMNQDWEAVVQVKESGEEVQIFMKMDDESIQGLVVMAVDGDEAVFINIMGMIDPNNLAELMDQFDVAVDI